MSERKRSLVGTMFPCPVTQHLYSTGKDTGRALELTRGISGINRQAYRLHPRHSDILKHLTVDRRYFLGTEQSCLDGNRSAAVTVHLRFIDRKVYGQPVWRFMPHCCFYQWYTVL